MRIAFDARCWSSSPSSFGRTLSCLVQGAEAAGIELELWVDGPLRPEYAGHEARAEGVLPLADAPARTVADVLWSPELLVPDAGSSLPVVATLYDVQPLLPDGRSAIVRWKRRLRFRSQVKRAAAAATRFMTVSEFSRRSIEREFPALAGRLDVVPLFADRTVATARYGDPAGHARLAAARLRPGYVLFVGSLRRHKNWDGLMRAYARIPPELTADHPLVLAGAARRAHDAAVRLAGELGIADRFHLLGEVEEELLQTLYAEAGVLAHVSLFEGFGLPPLEAMAHAVPVVASDRGSLPEVLGDAPVYVDPEDGPALTRALETLLTREDVHARVGAAGSAQAARYGPDRTGEAMRSLLAALGGRAG